MDTRFVIPVSVALAVHALAFLFPKSATPPRMVEPPLVSEVTQIPIDTTVPEPTTQKPEDESSAAQGQPNEPPISPDPVTKPERGDFIQPQQAPSPVVHSDLNKVPLGPVGIPGGKPGLIGVSPRILDGAALDHAPHARVQVAPTYPPAAKSRGLTAEVVVEFVVDEQGRVTAEHVVRSSDATFEDATLQAVRKWRFEPGKKDGRLVKFRLQVPVVFNLNE